MRIAISVLSKGKFAISQVKKVKLLFSTNLRFCLLLLIKQNCLQKTFLKTQNLKAQVSLYLSSWDNVKLYSVHVTPKLLKKITNLDLSKTCSCFLVVLKKSEPELSYILAELVNLCLREFLFPDCWKVPGCD